MSINTHTEVLMLYTSERRLVIARHKKAADQNALWKVLTRYADIIPIRVSLSLA